MNPASIVQAIMESHIPEIVVAVKAPKIGDNAVVVEVHEAAFLTEDDILLHIIQMMSMTEGQAEARLATRRVSVIPRQQTSQTSFQIFLFQDNRNSSQYFKLLIMHAAHMSYSLHETL